MRPMPRLVVNPDTPDETIIELKPGLNTVGRAAYNDFAIDHPSIADLHCEVFVTADNSVRIQDKGSASGTYVKSTLVGSAWLDPGEVFQLGAIELRLDSGQTPPVTASPALDSPPMAPPMHVGWTPDMQRFCRFHPKSAARYACPSCKKA